MNTKMNAIQVNNALDSLFELCSTKNDQQINLIVNILKQKGIILSRIGDIPNSIIQF